VSLSFDVKSRRDSDSERCQKLAASDLPPGLSPEDGTSTTAISLRSKVHHTSTRADVDGCTALLDDFGPARALWRRQSTSSRHSMHKRTGIDPVARLELAFNPDANRPRHQALDRRPV
jgi:hypothetical protein